jgi:hypothetical protein
MPVVAQALRKAAVSLASSVKIIGGDFRFSCDLQWLGVSVYFLGVLPALQILQVLQAKCLLEKLLFVNYKASCTPRSQKYQTGSG